MLGGGGRTEGRGVAEMNDDDSVGSFLCQNGGFWGEEEGAPGVKGSREHG